MKGDQRYRRPAAAKGPLLCCWPKGGMSGKVCCDKAIDLKNQNENIFYDFDNFGKTKRIIIRDEVITWRYKSVIDEIIL